MEIMLTSQSDMDYYSFMRQGGEQEEDFYAVQS